MAKSKKIQKAVALGYDEQKGTAPQILAGGKGLIAETIIERAKEAGIHIEENPDLVELLAKVPVGEEIPPELYQTIAEVLAFVYSVNDRFKNKMKQE
ncbi:MAG TPA: EscU/YscU/HrcU family type III secretion system export apparatus switch protein [Desulfobulbaceae bacterium]|nr:EscU/YscU/HrcU family type III secretion system export apparatus switch protein [Desulfobulbaceae bacterium]